MSRRPIEQPTRVDDTGPMGGFIESHPAYAQISAGRVSGRTTLYGSEFNHQHFVSLKITGSQMRRSLANDWPHAQMTPYIEVSMSEAQWAHFVSSLNSGTGALCTLEYCNGKEVPRLPNPESKKERFLSESAECIAEARQALADLADAIAASGLSKAKQKELLWKIEKAGRGIGSSQKYVADQFGEYMEGVTEKAKSEIDGYLVATLQSAGLQAIADMRSTVLIDDATGEQP
jgi:hypothetical protein